MRAGTKIAGFVAGLVAVGAVGAGVGALAGPVDTAGHDDDAGHEGSGGHDGDAGHEDSGGHDDDAGHEGSGGHGGTAGHEGTGASPAPGDPSGTTAGQDGYRLDLAPTSDEIRFRVLDPDGAPVVDTEVVHDRPLHLIVVGRDLTTYAHVHPDVAADGTWTVARPDLAPGSYRVVADLQPAGGPELALAGDLTVPGAVAPPAVPEASSTATVDDLTVALAGTPAVGEVDLAFTVTRAGEAVEPEPYLGARGHLVAFRAADLAYLHVHPHDGGRGPVAFTASFAAAGRYRLFLDLQVDGVVRTAAFTVEVPDGPTPTTSPAAAGPADGDDHGDDHDHGDDQEGRGDHG